MTHLALYSHGAVLVGVVGRGEELSGLCALVVGEEAAAHLACLHCVLVCHLQPSFVKHSF